MMRAWLASDRPSHGSFAAKGAMKLCGYHVPPGAPGSTKLTSGQSSAAASWAMSSGEPPRPWARMATAGASAGSGPVVSRRKSDMARRNRFRAKLNSRIAWPDRLRHASRYGDCEAPLPALRGICHEPAGG